MSTLAEIERAVASLPRPEQETLLRQLSASLQTTPHQQSPTERAIAASALLQLWLDEERGGEQVETGTWLLQTLEEDRAGQRSLFPSELRGVTW